MTGLLILTGIVWLWLLLGVSLLLRARNVLDGTANLWLYVLLTVGTAALSLTFFALSALAGKPL